MEAEGFGSVVVFYPATFGVGWLRGRAKVSSMFCLILHVVLGIEPQGLVLAK